MFLQELGIYLFIGHRDGDACPLSLGLSQINGMMCLNLTGLLYEFK